MDIIVLWAGAVLVAGIAARRNRRSVIGWSLATAFLAPIALLPLL